MTAAAFVNVVPERRIPLEKPVYPRIAVRMC